MKAEIASLVAEMKALTQEREDLKQKLNEAERELTKKRRTAMTSALTRYGANFMVASKFRRSSLFASIRNYLNRYLDLNAQRNRFRC